MNEKCSLTLAAAVTVIITEFYQDIVRGAAFSCVRCIFNFSLCVDFILPSLISQAAYRA